MKTVSVMYRNEFKAEVDVSNVEKNKICEEVLKKLRSTDVKFTIIFGLHEDYIEIFDENGKRLN